MCNKMESLFKIKVYCLECGLLFLLRFLLGLKESEDGVKTRYSLEWKNGLKMRVEGGQFNLDGAK